MNETLQALVLSALVCLAPARILDAAALAAGPPDTGAINIVVAASLPGRTFVRVNGEEASAGGYRSGDCSGGLLLPAGALAVEATNAVCQSSPPTRVTLPPNGALLLAVFALPAVDARPGTPPWRLEVRALPHRESIAPRSVSAVYFGAKPLLPIEASRRPSRLAPGQPAPLWRGAAEGFTLAIPPAPATALRLAELGHYWLILHDRPDGSAAHLLVFDPLYEKPIFD